MDFPKSVIAQVPNGRYFVLAKGKAEPLGVDKLRALSMANGMVLYWKDVNGKVDEVPPIALPEKQKKPKPEKKAKEIRATAPPTEVVPAEKPVFPTFEKAIKESVNPTPFPDDEEAWTDPAVLKKEKVVQPDLRLKFLVFDSFGELKDELTTFEAAFEWERAGCTVFWVSSKGEKISLKELCPPEARKPAILHPLPDERKKPALSPTIPLSEDLKNPFEEVKQEEVVPASSCLTEEVAKQALVVADSGCATPVFNEFDSGVALPPQQPEKDSKLPSEPSNPPQALHEIVGKFFPYQEIKPGEKPPIFFPFPRKVLRIKRSRCVRYVDLGDIDLLEAQSLARKEGRPVDLYEVRAFDRWIRKGIPKESPLLLKSFINDSLVVSASKVDPALPPPPQTIAQKKDVTPTQPHSSLPVLDSFLGNPYDDGVKEECKPRINRTKEFPGPQKVLLIGSEYVGMGDVGLAVAIEKAGELYNPNVDMVLYRVTPNGTWQIIPIASPVHSKRKEKLALLLAIPPKEGLKNPSEAVTTSSLLAEEAMEEGLAKPLECATSIPDKLDSGSEQSEKDGKLPSELTDSSQMSLAFPDPLKVYPNPAPPQVVKSSTPPKPPSGIGLIVASEKDGDSFSGDVTAFNSEAVEATVQGLIHPHPAGHVQFRVPGGVTRVNAYEGNGCGTRIGGLTPEAEEKGFKILPSLAETLSQRGASTGGVILKAGQKDLQGKY